MFEFLRDQVGDGLHDKEYQGQGNANSQVSDAQNKGRRKNFFERKRFLNYEGKGENAEAPDGAQGKRNSPGKDLPRDINNVNALNQRRRFDELKVQNGIGRDNSPI